jgi:hypothetical protein
MSFLRNRLLGGVSFLPLFAPEGVGSGAGEGAAAGAAAAAGAGSAAAGAGQAGAGEGTKAASAAPGAATLAGGADGGEAAAAAAAAAAASSSAAGKLPEGFDFRAYLAAGDKDVAKDLEKYTDPKAIYTALREVQAKISKGELKLAPKPLAANATDEQKAEWRKANGLPDKPENYVEKLELPNGMVVGEGDKELVGDFAKMMFEQGGSQAEMNRAVAWFYQAQDAMKQRQADADQESIIASTIALRSEWGSEYKANMNAQQALLLTMPEEFKNELLTSRTASGQMLGNTAGFLKWAAQTARDLNPAATIVPNGGDAGKTIGAEIASIEETFRKAAGGDGEAHRAYYGKDGQPGLDARHRELLGMQEKMQKRAS